MSKKCFGYINLMKPAFYLIVISLLSNACKSTKKYENTNALSKLDCAQYYNFSNNDENIISEKQEMLCAKETSPTIKIPSQKAKTHFQLVNKVVFKSYSTYTSVKVVVANPAKSFIHRKNQDIKENTSKKRSYLYIIITAALIGGLLIFFGYGLVYDFLVTIGVFLLLAIVFDLLAAIPYWTEDKKLLRKFYGRIVIISLIAGTILMVFLYLVVAIDLSFLGLILIVLLTFLLIVAALSLTASALAWLIMTIVEKRKSAR
jgi:hypothetical protein